jgi:hypothetical protein
LEVELADEVVGERSCYLGQPQVTCPLRSAFQASRQPLQDLQIPAHEPSNPRALDLHGDAPAVGQDGAMNLRDRGGRGRLGVELAEAPRRLDTQLFFEDLLHDRGGHRLGSLLQQAELVGDLRGNQVGPRGQELPKLDEHAARSFEGDPDCSTGR